jgi:hypothetical protein
MNNEITPENPEVISDEQLEEVSDGLFDDNTGNVPVHVLS